MCPGCAPTEPLRVLAHTMGFRQDPLSSHTGRNFSSVTHADAIEEWTGAHRVRVGIEGRVRLADDVARPWSEGGLRADIRTPFKKVVLAAHTLPAKEQTIRADP